MAYKCIHCSELYKDGSQEIIIGCAKCKSKFFFYIKDDKLKEIEAQKQTEEITGLNTAEKQQIEEDVREIAGITDEEAPIFLDFESVKIIKPGKYLLDLSKLFSQGKPRVYKLEDGKYIVDLANVAKEEKQE